MAVTAVQMLSAYNVIANAGSYVPPRLVSAVVDADGTRHPAPVAEGRPVVSPATADVITDMLANVVSADRGTGKQAQITGYSVAGKTGTAKKPQGENGYLDEHGKPHYMQVFAGFAPVDHPSVSLLVVLDESKRAQSGGEAIYGGEVAAPVFAELGKMALRQLHVPPTEAVDPSAQLAPEAAVEAGIADAADEPPVATIPITTVGTSAETGAPADGTP